MSATGRWDNRAACRGASLELFFPDQISGGGAAVAYGYAKRWCQVCPVRWECLDEAMELEGSASGKYRYGVYGGLDPNERAELHRETQPKVSTHPAGAACREERGTAAGYQRHGVAGEAACGDCKAGAARTRSKNRAEARAAKQQALAA